MNRSLSAPTTAAAGWRWVGFRFCFVYLGLYCLLLSLIPFTLLGLLGRWVHRLGGKWTVAPADPITGWVGRTFFGVDGVLHRDSGAGDQTANWVLAFCILVVAIVAAAVWTGVARRTAHPRLSAWFTVFLRLCLGGVMVSFGVAKLIPTQMPGPTLAQLLQPYGEMSPASVLWLQVGSSHPYEMALGAAEFVAGLLLFVPRTAVLGALSSVLCMAQVLLLNLTFDVPEKLLSGHLLLMGLVLLAPYCARLFDLFVRQRPCRPLTPPTLFTDARKNSIAGWVQVVIGLWVVLGGYDRWQVWQEQYGPDSPKSELYGIWEVRDFTLDGQPVPPLTTDENRWQRIVFDDPAEATYQRMSGELVAVRAEFRPDGQVILSDETTQPFATLSAERPVPDRLSLRGTLRGRPVTVTLDRVDPNSFTLNSRGFHWVQDYPYFR
ncbi:DoxX family protein [Nocardia otitidiscaviarum]|uniref:DoxX family protein n=1 Tax=Nocardia otitidiscaviarum TaxID=1823 RepID=UPI00189610C7|nr:DoxX family protein [Nocardia otitidiscaviarum]MBF6237077.1 DoxX family protein [Nocardia otitidiscaviarum]